MAVAAKKRITLEGLASTLDLRINTVWGFRRKVTERVAELEKNGRKPSASRWEDLVLFGLSEGTLDVRARVSGFLRRSLERLRK